MESHLSDNVHQNEPSMLKKQKVHLTLHLVEYLKQFGPTSSFNSERYENLYHTILTSDNF